MASKCELYWNKLELKTSTGKKLLSNVSGVARPGTITAILGASGSGKSTLLNTLAGRNAKDFDLEGEIKANGHERGQYWPWIISYVLQDFPFHRWQTVHETLLFTAKIKCSDSESRAQWLMGLLGLSPVKDTFVGHLSRGEQVRLAIGLELLGDPAVVLLDEPLSGLDSFNALNVLGLLKKIAELGKTVILTVHQPSYKICEYFDGILLISQGTVAFEGTIANCTRFFESCGFELPPKTTPTDFFLDLLALDTRSDALREESQNRIRTLIREWNLIRQPGFPSDIEQNFHLPIIHHSSWMELFRRELLSHYRNTQLLRVRLFQRIFLVVVLGITFFKTGVLGADIFTFRGILIFFTQNEIFGITTPILNTFANEKKILMRECMSGLYSGTQAYLSKFIVEFLSIIFFAFPYISITYALVGFPLSAFPIFILSMIAIVLYAIAWGITISLLTSNVQASHVVSTSFNLIFMLYSGIFSPPEFYSLWLKWIFWVSPFHYAFRALVHSQLSGVPDASVVPTCISGEGSLTTVFHMNEFGVIPCILTLLIYTAGLVVGGCVMMTIRTSGNLLVKKTIK